MKLIQSLLCAGTLLVGTSLSAAIIIPDGNLTGIEQTLNYGGFGDGVLVTDLIVSLQISSGRIGDFYVSLEHLGTTVVLLNRIGMGEQAGGYSYAGVNISFRDGNPDIHTANTGTGPLTGVFEADGRNVSPFSVTTGSARSDNPFSVFNGSVANGDWTIFISDVNGNTMEGSLDAWAITAVPEPTTWAIIIFGALFGGAQVVRRWRNKRAVSIG